jgi:hypothetical protein
MNRFYHQTNTRFNGLYNSNELIKQSLISYAAIHNNDFDEILSIEVVPNGDDQIAFYPPMDTVVSKCTKLITKHSMPGFGGRGKRDEWNKWMDDVWLTVGYAKYFKGDYEGAVESFRFIEKFFSNASSRYTARLWLAKCAIQTGNLVEAKSILREIERDAENTTKAKEAEKEEKGKKPTSKRKKKSKKKQKKRSKKDQAKKASPPPPDFVYELNKIKADIAIKEKKFDKAQEYMKIVVEDIKKKEESARMLFIYAQLCALNGEKETAVASYGSVLKKKAPFPLHFAAELSRAMSASGSDQEKLIAQLKKMANEQKNLEYRDQIYFALGNISENASKKDDAMADYTKSVYFSISNNKQKAKSYERMGDLKLGEKDYFRAQKYYDSCARVAPQDFKNRELIERRANKLRDLVEAIEMAHLQDSLLRIAAMSPAEQEAFLGNVKKQLEKEEKERLAQEAKRAAELAQMQADIDKSNAGRGGGGGNRWYFYNERTKADGFEDYKRVWGQRDLEDDWRRINKIATTSSMASVTDTAGIDTLVTADIIDKFSIESLAAGIPKDEEQIAIAQKILLENLYKSGRIYNEELDETGLAIGQFESVLTYRIEDKHILLAAFELYRLNEGVNPNQRNYYANYIKTNYPESEYAKFIEDPEYFVKKREREVLDLEDYETLIERFRSGMYSLVRSKSSRIIQNEPFNAYRSGYMLLNAMSEAGVRKEKKESIPFFEGIIAEFPGSKEAERAQTMIDIINNGYSADIAANFESSQSSEFSYGSGKMLFVLVANVGDKVTELSKDLSNFNQDFFGSDKLKTKTTVLGLDKDIVNISSFRNITEAEKYLKAFQKSKRTVKHLQSHTHFIITQENFAKLIMSGNIEGYINFYKDFY